MMLLPRVELPRQSLKEHQRNEQAGVSGIIEKTRARRKAAQRCAGRTLSRWGGNPPEGLSCLIIGLAFKTTSCLQLLCLNFLSLWSWVPGHFLENRFHFFWNRKIHSPEPGKETQWPDFYLWSFETYGTLMRRCSPVKRVNLALLVWNGGGGVRPGLSSLFQQTLWQALW